MEDRPRASAPPRADDVISEERYRRYHEFAREPGVMPAREPDRYVTLSVRETSGRVDAEALSRAFDLPAHPEARISLPSVYRMLQRVGGDLSVEVEPGRGSTFTLFLPRGARPARSAAA